MRAGAVGLGFGTGSGNGARRAGGEKRLSTGDVVRVRGSIAFARRSRPGRGRRTRTEPRRRDLAVVPPRFAATRGSIRPHASLAAQAVRP